jgi:hypothetical protein
MVENSLNPKLGKEVKLGYVSIESQIKFLQGKVLTVIDASYSEQVQKKAVKDLINKFFSEQLTWILELCAPEMNIKSRDNLMAQGIDVEAIERGAVVEE